jgi:hypothetical protein
MGTISTAEVLRLRARSAVTRDKSVRRSSQDDDFVASWRGKNQRLLGFLLSGKQISAYGAQPNHSLYCAAKFADIGGKAIETIHFRPTYAGARGTRPVSYIEIWSV